MKQCAKEHPLYTSFQKEKKEQIKAYNQFQEDLKKDTNFNSRFLPIFNLIKGYPHQLSDDQNERTLLYNTFFTQIINLEDLYASGLWDGIIQNWILLQTNGIKDKNKFAKDFKVTSDRITNAIQYTDFVSKITFYLAQYGNDDYIDAITPTIKAANKLLNYNGVLRLYQKEVAGKAENLEIIEPIAEVNGHLQKKKTIDLAKIDKDYKMVVFYESGCGPCEDLLQGLKDNYNYLLNKKIEIITISSDRNEAIFKNTSDQFPWVHTYCDLQGMNGINFKNYAVIGTPTIYIIDRKDNIIQKMTTISDILKWSTTL